MIRTMFYYLLKRIVYESRIEADVQERPRFAMLLGYLFQHLLPCLARTVLVPILVGIDPAVALLSCGSRNTCSFEV